MNPIQLARRFLAALPPADSDSSLLSRFVVDGDHEAFAELVRESGPLVLATCRSIEEWPEPKRPELLRSRFQSFPAPPPLR